MVGRTMGMVGVIWEDVGWGWVTSYGRTEDGVGWRQMVGRRMGMGNVKW